MSLFFSMGNQLLSKYSVTYESINFGARHPAIPAVKEGHNSARHTLIGPCREQMKMFNRYMAPPSVTFLSYGQSAVVSISGFL